MGSLTLASHLMPRGPDTPPALSTHLPPAAVSHVWCPCHVHACVAGTAARRRGACCGRSTTCVTARWATSGAAGSASRWGPLGREGGGQGRSRHCTLVWTRACIAHYVDPLCGPIAPTHCTHPLCGPVRASPGAAACQVAARGRASAGLGMHPIGCPPCRALAPPPAAILIGNLSSLGGGAGGRSSPAAPPPTPLMRGLCLLQAGCRAQHKECKSHRPEGCRTWYEERGRRGYDCPLCLMLPALTLLRRISNHPELVKPQAALRDANPRQVGASTHDEG